MQYKPNTMKNFFILFIILNSSLFYSQCWKSVMAGHRTAYAIKDDGTLWAWGKNNFGQMGNSSITDFSLPTQIGFDTDWSEIATIDNSNHALILKTDGSLWGWGWNDNGQIGNGTNVSTSSPIQIGTDKNWKSVACGFSHTLALKTDGSLWTWGSNSNGELGLSSLIDYNIPTKVGNDNDWASIAAGYNSSFAIKINGTLWGWGKNDKGQLGNGTYMVNINYTPTQIGGDTNWKKISTGTDKVSAIKTDGTLWEWGERYESYSGGPQYQKTPIQVGNQNQWVDIDKGYNFSTVLKSDGTLWAWGTGILGDGTYHTLATIPILVNNETDWKMSSSGMYYSLSIKNNNTIWSWGTNIYGTLGDGTTIQKLSPISVACSASSLATNETKNSTFEIFPNPTKNFISVKGNSEIIEINLYTIDGRFLKGLPVNSEKININFLEKGIYLIKIEDKQHKFYIKKIIKE